MGLSASCSGLKVPSQLGGYITVSPPPSNNLHKKTYLEYYSKRQEDNTQYGFLINPTKLLKRWLEIEQTMYIDF